MVKNPCTNSGDMGLIPGSGRFPGEGNGNPLQHSCLENPMGRGAWWGYSPWGHKEWDTRELSHDLYARYVCHMTRKWWSLDINAGLIDWIPWSFKY